jgi:hypothetical protein
MARLPYDGPGCISSNTDREQELQHPSEAERHIAEGVEHIKWQREVLAILERISVSAEAIEGARALLTTFLQTQAQREQDHDRIRASVDCTLDLSSTIPLGQPVDHQNEAAGVGGVAGLHLRADLPPVQLEAKKLENLGEGRPSETASFDAVSQDEADDRLNISRSMQRVANDVTHFMPFGYAAAIEPKVVKCSYIRPADLTFPSPASHSPALYSINFFCHPHLGALDNSETISVSFTEGEKAMPGIQGAVEQGILPVSQAAMAVVIDTAKQHQIVDRVEAGYVLRLVRAAAAWITGLARRVARYRSRRDTARRS